MRRAAPAIHREEEMPYEVIWEGRCAYTRFWGELSAQEYNKAQEVVFADPRFDALRCKISDFLGVTSVSVTEEDVEYLATYNHGPNLTNPNIRFVYVTTDARIIALIRHAATLSAYELGIFSTLKEARSWGSEGMIDRPRGTRTWVG